MVRTLTAVLLLIWLVTGMGTAWSAGGSFFHRDSERAMHPWPVEVKDEGGTLLFSDSPEYVSEYGILYTDVVKGEARVYYYHVNVTQKPGKLAVVLENLGPRPETVYITRSALPMASADYFEVGKGAEILYMHMPQAEKKLMLGAGERRVLDTLMAEELLLPKQLGSGMYDLKTASRVRVSVVFCPADADPEEFVTGAKVLPRDEVALRGTFQGMNRLVKAKKKYDPDKDGLVYIPIGDGEKDAFKEGVDATDGSLAVNFGNYGVVYRLEVPTRGKKQTHMLLSPLGGVYAGAVRVLMGKKEERLVHTPAGRMFFGDETPGDLVTEVGGKILLTPDFELSYLGSYRSYRKMAVEYSPPGASNLPVLFIMAPNTMYW